MKAVLDHIGIAIDDIDAALAFYRDALGLEAAFALKNPPPSADSVSGSPGDRGNEDKWQKRAARSAS